MLGTPIGWPMRQSSPSSEWAAQQSMLGEAELELAEVDLFVARR
jgi:hypothetical protein